MKRSVLTCEIQGSLGYYGHKAPWLAKRLGTSSVTAYRRLNDDLWTVPEFAQMAKMFKWDDETIIKIIRGMAK